MKLGRAGEPPQRRPMYLACHNLETIRQELATRETSQPVEKQPGQVLKGHYLAMISPRYIMFSYLF